MLTFLAAALAGAPSPRFDLELQAAEVHATIRMLAELGDLDVVVPDTVSGTVSLRLRDVTWETALAAVLAAEGLVAVRTGPESVRVAPALAR